MTASIATTTADTAHVLAEFQPGVRVYLQGAGGEPLALRPILQGAPDALAGVSLLGCPLPGINDFDYTALHPRARQTVFMLSPALRASFELGRTRVLPLPYSQIAAFLQAGPPFDLAIFQLGPPDNGGLCSFGPCADFAPIVWRNARRRLAFVNPNLPRLARGPAVPFADLDVAIDAPGPILTGVEAPPSTEQTAIARTIAGLVPDGAALQSGIGGAPAAAIAHLADRRALVIRSGLATEGYRTLDEAGALDPAADHIVGMAHGSAGLLAWAAQRLTFADARTTHGADVLAALPRLHAINSALEVDLFGQANVEWRGGRLVSGLGGAPDFARAARRSAGGRAILALPSSARGVSRIVPRLAAPTVSIPRDDTDLVVTEHGAADLRGTDLDARAEALFAVAAPEHRAGLADAWAEMRRGL